MRKIAKEFGVSPSTLHDRVNGRKSKKESCKDRQILTERQERSLEGYLLFLVQRKTPLNRIETRKLAGKLKYDGLSPNDIKLLSDNWFKGFLSRCKYLNLSKGNLLGISRARENGKTIISLFFDLYFYYIDMFNINSDDIWSLDEAQFKINESSNEIQLSVIDNSLGDFSHDSFDLVTALEMISKTGKVGKPLLIFKDGDQMTSWVPGGSMEESKNTTCHTNFTNEKIFQEWISDHFSSDETKCSFLLLNGHLSRSLDQMMATLISKRILLLYYPSHMTKVLEPSNRSCFKQAKIHNGNEISHNIGVGLSSIKTNFLETYMLIRKEAYESKTIVEGWKKTGLLENNTYAALTEYKSQPNHAGFEEELIQEGSEKEESADEAEIVNINTPITL